jgi:hypothetical protein
VTLIDLDHEPDEAPAPPRRGRTWLLVVAAVVLGGVLGGLAMVRLQDRRLQDRVAPVVLVDTGWVGDGPQLVEGGGQLRDASGKLLDPKLNVQLGGHVVVVNAGPAAFKLRGLKADPPGFRLTGDGVDTWVAPGRPVYAPVWAAVTCTPQPDLAEIRATVTIEPRDGDTREITVTFQGHQWGWQIEKGCAKIAS